MAKKIKVADNVERGNTGLAIKAGFWYVASTFLLKGIAFLTIPIFSRLLSKNDYGEFANYANWQATLLVITGAELYNSLSRAYYDFKKDYDQFISSVVILSILNTAVVYILFILNSTWVLNVVKIPSQFVHVMFFTLMCSSCKALYLTRERTLYRYRSVAVISAIDTIIPTIIAVLLVAASKESARLSARIYGFYLPSSAIGLTCALVLLEKGKSFKRSHCIYALKLSLPLLLHYLTVSLLTSTNTIIANNLGGPALGAEISMATSVIHLLTILFQALSGALTTWMMDNLAQEQYFKIKKESVLFIAGLAAVSVGVILIAPELIRILGGEQYYSSVALIPWLVIAAFIQSLTTILTIILTYDKNVVKTAIIAGIAAVSSVVLKVLLFPQYGAICLPVVNIVICSIMLFANYMLVSQAGYKKAVPFGKYGLFICIVLGVGLLSSFLYTHSMVRYGIVGIMAAVAVGTLILYRDALKRIIKKRET